MIASSVIKVLKGYLSSLNARCAVYGEELKLEWTNCEEFFGTLDTGVIADALPIKKETPVSVTVGDVKYVMNVVPLYRSKRLVSGYVCVLRDSFELYRMINSSAIADFNELSLQDSREKLNQIISINKAMEDMLEKGEVTDKAVELMKKQYRSAARLYTEASSSMALGRAASGGSEDEPAVNCNVSILLKGLCTEAAQCLVKTKRKLIKKLDTKNYYARIDYKTFAVAFLGAFRSHLHISPLKSSVEVSSAFDGGDYVITIRTEALPENEPDAISRLRAQQDLELARKIICGDFGGSLSFTRSRKEAVSVIRVPVIKKNRGALLNSANSGYLAGNYRPVRAFVDEITEKEELAVTAEARAQSASAKTAARKGGTGKGKKRQASE